ncbi:MAG: nucleobase:cation symporter, family [Chloroflexota bacterium]|nr:nucleobase:cation symporter, family [Chloroflexota bacterium]
MSGEIELGPAMPSRSGDLSIEARGMEPIPPTNRYGSPGRIFTVWFAPNLVPPAFFLGTLAAADFLQLGFTSGLIAIILGNLIGSSLVGLLITMGPKTGMAQLPFARLPFGKSIVLPAGINWLACIAWDAFDTIFGAAAISLLTGLPFVFGVAVIIVAQAVIGIIGYEAIHTFQKWMSVVLAALFVAITIGVIRVGDFGSVDGFTGADQLAAFVTMTTIVASFVMAWGVYASDYSRYLPSQTSSRALFLATVGGLTLSAGWLEILGLSVAGIIAGNGVENIRDDVLGGGLIGALAMVAMALGTVSVNVMNDYTGSLSLQAAGIRIPRPVSAAVVATLAFFLTLVLNSGDLAASFGNYLLLLSYWVAPFAAVVLVDWWLRGQRADPWKLLDLRQLPSGWTALIAFVVGLLASVPFMSTALFIGPISSGILHFADVAYFVGFAVAGLVYWVLARIGNVPAEEAAPA